MPTKPAPIATLAALLSLVFWGGTAIANRYAVAFADPIVVATLRSILAGIIALAVALTLRLKWPAGRNDQLLLLLSGLCSFAMWQHLEGLLPARSSHLVF